MTSCFVADMQLNPTVCRAAAPIDSAHLAKYTLGEPRLEREVLQLFCEQLERTIPMLKGAVSDKEWRLATHTLKGSGRAVGAWRLAEAAAVAERLDRCDRASAIRALEDAAGEVVAHIHQRAR